MLNPSEVALGPVVARVLVHEVARTEELAKRRRLHSVDHAGLEEYRAWYVLATRGFVVKFFLRSGCGSRAWLALCTIRSARWLK